MKIDSKIQVHTHTDTDTAPQNRLISYRMTKPSSALGRILGRWRKLAGEELTVRGNIDRLGYGPSPTNQHITLPKDGCAAIVSHCEYTRYKGASDNPSSIMAPG